MNDEGVIGMFGYFAISLAFYCYLPFVSREGGRKAETAEGIEPELRTVAEYYLIIH